MEPILLYLLLINLLTLFIWGYDKQMAKKNRQRISETRLLLIVFFGGMIGGIFGIFLFRHKSSKQILSFNLIVSIFTQRIFLYNKCVVQYF